MNTVKLKDYKRINFQLPLSLAREFELAAQKEGITKAKLLRRWIQATDEQIDQSGNLDEQVTSFNLRLSARESHKLAVKASFLNFTLSRYLRCLILTNIAKSRLGKESRSIDIRLETDNLKDVAQLLERDIDRLDLNQLFLLTDTYVDIGSFQKAESLLSYILELPQRSLYTKEITQAKVELVKARLSEYTRNPLSGNTALANASILTENAGDTSLQAATHYHYGVAHLMQEDYSMSLDSFHQSLEFLTTVQNPRLVGKIYLRLADAHIHLLNLDLSSYYLDRGRELLLRSNNTYDLIWYMNKAEISIYNSVKFNEVHQDLEQAGRYATSSGSIKELQYHLDNVGRKLLVSHKESEAYSVLTQAEKLDQSYRPEAGFSYSKALKLYIESKHSYQRAVTELIHSISSSSNFRPNTLEYILATTQFLRAPLEADRKNGQQKLRRIASEGKGDLIRKIASDTLVTHELQLYR